MNSPIHAGFKHGSQQFIQHFTKYPVSSALTHFLQVEASVITFLAQSQHNDVIADVSSSQIEAQFAVCAALVLVQFCCTCTKSHSEN